MQHDPQTPRLRRDGSIDTGFYLARGRHARSRQAHDLAGRGARRIGALPIGVLAALAVVFALSSGLA